MRKSVRILALAFIFIGLAGCQQQNQPSDTTTDQANIDSLTLNKDAGIAQNNPRAASNPVGSNTINILILGDSITAGFGLDTEQAYPALLQTRLDDLGWDFKIINGGVSGDTSAGGLRRIKWMLRETVDILILELGGNDGLRGTPPEVTKQNLQAIIDEVKTANADVEVVLAGMQIPPNLGQEYTTQFREVFPTLATENDALLIPFLLDNVGGIPSLNQPDGIHPTAQGHKIVADNVWKILKPLLSSIVNA